MKAYTGVAAHALPDPKAPDFTARLRDMIATIDVWARDASFGFGRLERGEAPSGSGASIGVTDHGALSGLLDDDHLQYLYLSGRTDGQVLTHINRLSIPFTIKGAPSQSSDFFRINDDSDNDLFSFKATGAMFSSSSSGGSTMSYGLADITQTRSLDTTGLSIVPQTGLILGRVAAGPKVYIDPALGAPNTSPTAWDMLLRANHASASRAGVLITNQGAGTGPLATFQFPEGTDVARITSKGAFRGRDVASDLTAQTGSIGATTLLTGTADTAGMYRVSVYIKTTTAGAGGDVVAVTVAYNDGTAQTVVPIAAHDLATLNAHSQASVVLNLAASQNISYTTTVTIAGAPQYEIHVRTEYLG